MAGKQTKPNKNAIIAIAVIAVVVILVAVFFLTRNSSNSTSNNNQASDGSKLAQIQKQIEDQQKVIENINKDLAPLIEERQDLEKQLEQLTLPSTTETTDATEDIESTEVLENSEDVESTNE